MYHINLIFPKNLSVH